MHSEKDANQPTRLASGPKQETLRALPSMQSLTQVSRGHWPASQLNGCTIDAVCLMQKRPAQDTAEAEWYGLVFMCRWIEWYRQVFSEIGLIVTGPTTIRHDNQVVGSLIQDNDKLGRTLHWRIAQHYPRFLYINGVVVVEYYQSSMMAADMLNKSLPFPAMSRHRRVIQGPQEEGT